MLSTLTSIGLSVSRFLLCHDFHRKAFSREMSAGFFKNQCFCLTGKFMMGPRANHEFEIKDRGGITHANVTEETNYLVIGSMGSTDWLHSTFGRKIEKAVSLAERGHPIALISEEHWADHLL